MRRSSRDCHRNPTKINRSNDSTSPSNSRGINTEIEISSPQAGACCIRANPATLDAFFFLPGPVAGLPDRPCLNGRLTYFINKWRSASSLLTANKSITVAAETIETLGIDLLCDDSLSERFIGRKMIGFCWCRCDCRWKSCRSFSMLSLHTSATYPFATRLFMEANSKIMRDDAKESLRLCVDVCKRSGL